MSKKLVMATANPNKIIEISKKLGTTYQFLSLKDIGCLEDIPETQDTIEGNALQKARYVYEHFGHNCFAEDTGLEIEALDGRPGVKTARYAGEDKNDQNNINKVLTELKGQENRKARFKTVIALIIDGKEMLFEGLAPGQITEEPIGEDGFGYDPVFQPEGYENTYAQMDMQMKNIISHRAKAVDLLKAHLDSL